MNWLLIGGAAAGLALSIGFAVSRKGDGPGKPGPTTLAPILQTALPDVPTLVASETAEAVRRSGAD